ncbi:MAG: phosphomethylpyrimidine synthase ThiC [Promethearchaeota archaeon]
MTILEESQKGKFSEYIKQVAEIEHLDIQKVRHNIANGHAVIMTGQQCKPVGIGSIFRTKINVNIGTSSSTIDFKGELEKVRIAEKYGADTLSDLSMGGDIDAIRKKIIESSSLPITTVPIYQAVVEAQSLTNISEESIFKVIQKQILDGISSIVIHAGFTLNDIKKMDGKRVMGIVSKGGSFTASIMSANSIENPFATNFEYILELIKEQDIVINLGNAMRSGCIHDRIDGFQISEMKRNGKLAKQANKKGIQVILESLGGHVNAKDLIEHVRLHKIKTANRPLFVSGPLPVDNAVGYDHISAAIGGAFASGYGADYLCAITPAEHLSLPTVEDIKRGLIACRIAAHVGDSMKFGLNHLFNDDLELSKNRFIKNWGKQFQHSIDPEEPIKRHHPDEKTCSMCGKFCALSISKKIFKNNN